MTRRTTLFLVCAFEIALILFVAAWSALANTDDLYACVQWIRINDEIKMNEKVRSKFPDKVGRNFILTDDGENLTIVTRSGQERQIARIGRHNEILDIYQTLQPSKFNNHTVFFVNKSQDTIEIMSVHPLATFEYKITCQK